MRTIHAITLGLTLCCTTVRAAGNTPTDTLLTLLPPDVAAVAVVEDLRGTAARIEKSDLAKGIQALPEFQDWLRSPDFLRLDEARREIERAVGSSWIELRDNVLGDAVVFALRPSEDGGMAKPGGVVLALPRDQTALTRLVDAINLHAQNERKIARVEPRAWQDIPYQARLVAPSDAVGDCYVFLPSGVFAWASSESLIRAVIDQHLRPNPATPSPWIGSLRSQLPGDSVASVLISRSMISSVLDAARTAQDSPDSDPASAAVLKVLDGLEGVGASFRWRDTLELQLVQLVDVTRLPGSLRAFVEGHDEPGTSATAIPQRTIAVLAGHWNYRKILAAVHDAIPSTERARVAMLETALSGISFGVPIRDELLPALGPESLLLALRRRDAAPTSAHWPEIVVSIELKGEARIAAALANAARTALALASLDEKQSSDNASLDSAETDSTWIIRWSRGDARLFVLVTPNRLLVGSSEDAVSALREPTLENGVSMLDDLRRSRPSRPWLFAGVDHAALVEWLNANRAWLISHAAAEPGETEESATRELDSLTALIRLFRASAATISLEDGGHRAREVLELLPAAPDTSPVRE